MMHYDGNLFCVAFVHDYGEMITGLAVPKNHDGGKDFSLPYLNINLKDLEQINGTGYELKIGNLVEVIPSEKIFRFVKDVRKQISSHKQTLRKNRRKR